MMLTMKTLFSFACMLATVKSTYDLIDATPLCYTLGLCTKYGKWGTYTSIHPNSEEKTQRTLINLARMFPDDYIASPYGKYYYGTSGPSWEYDTDGYCGTAADIPYYWLSSVNQASRFGSWDCQYCNSSCGHSTCGESPDRCTQLFGGDCGFDTRCDAFLVEDNDNYGIYCSAEGLCGANLCYDDGHCSAMFNPDSRIFGIGFAPLTNGITISYTNGYDDSINELVDYSIANVAHFDERIKVNYRDYNDDGNYLTFMLQWFDTDKLAKNVFVAYKGGLVDMDLAYGNSNNGFWKVNVAIPDHCEPYYFIVETTDDSKYRMPELDRYMFGTAWSNWSWWQPDGTGTTPSKCEENHYYLLDGGDTWVANGGPNVPIDSDDNCAGCSNTYGITDYWVSTGTPQPTTATGPDTQSPTKQPTDKPTTPDPTAKPTAKPTTSPTTAKPTGNPTNKPIASDTPSPTDGQTEKPTANPTDKPVEGPATTEVVVSDSYVTLYNFGDSDAGDVNGVWTLMEGDTYNDFEMYSKKIDGTMCYLYNTQLYYNWAITDVSYKSSSFDTKWSDWVTVLVGCSSNAEVTCDSGRWYIRNSGSFKSDKDAYVVSGDSTKSGVSSRSSGSSESEESGTEIVIIVVAVAAGLLAIFGAIMCYRRKHAKNQVSIKNDGNDLHYGLMEDNGL